MPAFLRWLLRLGPTNPIAVRLVQGGSRRTRHMYIRTGYLAALIAVLLWSLLLSAGRATLSYRELAAAGASSFEMVAYLQIGLICVLAPVFMAGAIAQESNPRTWDILLTTPLSRGQIVLGNLLGRLFFVAALLFSSMPLFAITQYFGGVPGRSVLASYAIALCAATLVGSIAIALSVSRIGGKRAVFAFYVGVLTVLAATWAADLALRARTGGVTALTATNPFLALEALLNPSSYPRPSPEALAGMGRLQRWWMGAPVTAWCAWSALVSVGLVAAASLTVRTAGTGEGAVPLHRRLLGLGARGAMHRPPREVWQNPIAWREASARASTLAKRLTRAGFLGAGLLWGLGLIAAFHGGMDARTFRGLLLATVWTELAVITLVAINMAGTAVSREREDGTLDLLLTTPITPKAYLGGKLRGIISYLAPMMAVPLLTLAFAGLYVLVGGFDRQGGVMVRSAAGTGLVEVPVVLPEVALTAPMVVAPFLAFVVMIGLQWSVRSKGAIGSVVATVGVVAVVAGIVGLCGWQAGAQIPVAGPGLAALNPVTLLFASVEPAAAGEATIVSTGLAAMRYALVFGAIAGGILYAALVYAMHASMVRRFDATVRRLAGTN